MFVYTLIFYYVMIYNSIKTYTEIENAVYCKLCNMFYKR